MGHNAFRVLKDIGRGSYGTVKLIEDLESKRKFVLKEVDLSRASAKERLAAEMEAKILSTLKHPNIVQHKGSYQTKDGMHHIIMAYCDGGDLHSNLTERRSDGLLSESMVLNWFVQIVMAVQYIHERHILHRDIKTPNIFLTKSSIIKLGDFGISKILEATGDYATTLIGTPYFTSPEIFLNQPYNYKSDIWGVGCCLYELCTLRYPFTGKDISTLADMVLESKVTPISAAYSPELHKILRVCLHKIPEKRPSANKILKHPLIRKHITTYLRSSFRPPSDAVGLYQTKTVSKSTYSLLANTYEPLLPLIDPTKTTRRERTRKTRKGALLAQQQSTETDTTDEIVQLDNDNGDDLTEHCRSKSAPRQHSPEHADPRAVGSAGYMRANERRMSNSCVKTPRLDAETASLYKAMENTLHLPNDF